MLSTQEVAYNEKEMEPILKPNDKRFVLFPIEYPEVTYFSASHKKGMANV